MNKNVDNVLSGFLKVLDVVLLMCYVGICALLIFIAANKDDPKAQQYMIDIKCKFIGCEIVNVNEPEEPTPTIFHPTTNIREWDWEYTA